MDNNEVKVFDKVEGTEEGEICASDNQSMAFPYSVDRPLVIYYEAKKEKVSREVKPSLIIEVPAPFPYKNNKAVPWNYDVNIIVPEGDKSNVVSEGVSGVGHFTRSGRCYSPETVEPKKKVVGPSQKGKAPMYEVEDDVEIPPEQEVKKAEPLAYPHLSRTFTSAGVMYPGQNNSHVTLLIENGLQNISLNAIDNENDAIKNASMIRPCPPGYVLNN
ncbi:hypothetical protein GOBAR_DD01337 [Gossypium barbadense]|nr:hypothetical protein GOBAR_DD01337 [Gossypium barbadense]